MNLLIDEATGDLSFDNDGKLELVYDDADLIQRLRIRLQDVKGDWFRNTEYGTDWFGSILGKRSDVVRRAEIRRVLIETVGIQSVLRLELEYAGTDRSLTVDFTVLKMDGLTLDVRFEDVL